MSEAERDDFSYGFDESPDCLPFDQNDDDDDDNDLIQALPVPEDLIPTETATPVDLQKKQQQQEEDNATSRKKYCLALLASAVLLIIMAVVVVSVVRKKHSEDTSSAVDHHNSTANATTNTQPDVWTWDLPFSVSNSTLNDIQEGMDYNYSTPQHNAYLWMKNDPHWTDYSRDQLQQRFAMAVFYFATQGEDWLHQGGEMITVQAGGGGT